MNEEYSIMLKHATELAQSMKDAGHIIDFEIRTIDLAEMQMEIYIKPVKPIDFIYLDPKTLLTYDPHKS